jgi:predicted ArsR family transcriptional regulator
MIARREQATVEKYEQVLLGAEILEEPVVRLVGLCSLEGSMSDSTQRDDGFYIIIENHCLICAAAASCRGFLPVRTRAVRAIAGSGTGGRSEHRWPVAVAVPTSLSRVMGCERGTEYP